MKLEIDSLKNNIDITKSPLDYNALANTEELMTEIKENSERRLISMKEITKSYFNNYIEEIKTLENAVKDKDQLIESQMLEKQSITERCLSLEKEVSYLESAKKAIKTRFQDALSLFGQKIFSFARRRKSFYQEYEGVAEAISPSHLIEAVKAGMNGAINFIRDADNPRELQNKKSTDSSQLLKINGHHKRRNSDPIVSIHFHHNSTSEKFSDEVLSILKQGLPSYKTRECKAS